MKNRRYHKIIFTIVTSPEGYNITWKSFRFLVKPEMLAKMLIEVTFFFNFLC